MKTIVFFGALLFCSDSSALGRLFTTEAQRHQLEHPSEQQAQAQAQSRPTEKTEPVLWNGFVKSRQGRKTLWINGNMHDKSKVGIRLLGLSAGRVIVDAQGRRIALKPGQMLDMNRREIKEVYDRPANTVANDGQVSIANPPSPPATQTEEAIQADLPKLDGQLNQKKPK
jgi:hypothetical protein